MERDKSEIDLNEIRKEINNIDEEIVRLIERRFNCAMKVGQYKKKNDLPIYDENRESKVIEKCVKLLSNEHYTEYLEKLYTDIMGISKEIQENEVFKSDK